MRVNKLKARVISLGRTQQDVAAELKIHRVYLSDIGRGVKKPSVRLLKQLETVLQCNAVELGL